MSRIRIECKPDPRALGLPPSLVDCRIFAVSDDGTEVELHNVVAVQFIANGSDAAMARLTFVRVEADLVAEVKS